MSMQIQASTLAYADTEPTGVATMSDPAAALLALMLQNSAAQSGAARADIDHATQAIEDTRRQVKEAMQRAADAQEHSGFFHKLSEVFSGDIGALCELVAAAAVVAATGGVGVAGVLAISAAAFSVSGEVAKRAGASPAVCCALSGMGALAGIAVGNVGGASAAWQAVAMGAKGAGAVATGAGIGATVVSSDWQATAMDRQADATAARGEQSAAAADFDLALGQLERAARDASRAGSTAANIVQTENDGRMSLVARLGAA